MAGFIPDPVPFSFDGALVEAEAHKQISAWRGAYEKLQKKFDDAKKELDNAKIRKNALFRVLKEEIAAGKIDEESAIERFQQHVEEQEKRLTP